MPKYAKFYMALFGTLCTIAALLLGEHVIHDPTVTTVLTTILEIGTLLGVYQVRNADPEE
jgi:hypothetical protein